MSTIRQDAWSDDEDLLLAETVLRHIREGSTQLTAFEEVGKNLSRTSAACGFRWNSLVRKRYENAISLAKKQRKELSKKNKETSKAQKERSGMKIVEPVNTPVEEEIANTSEEFTLSLKHVIAFLEDLEQESQQSNLKEEQEEFDKKLKVVSKENEQLLKENKKLKENFKTIKADYQSLIQIMDRARKFTQPLQTDVDPQANGEEDSEQVSEILQISGEND